MVEDPQKFSTSNFFNFLKNKRQNWLPRTLQISRGTKSGIGLMKIHRYSTEIQSNVSKCEIIPRCDRVQNSLEDTERLVLALKLNSDCYI